MSSLTPEQKRAFTLFLTVPSFRGLPLLAYPLAVSCRTYVRHLCIDFEIPPARSGWHRLRFWAGRPIPYSCNPPAKGNIKKKSGTVWATARVSSNRGIRTKVFERVCHTMPGVREASSFVPEIGTADTSDKRGIFAEFPSRGVSDLLNPCAGSFCNFLRSKS